MVAIWREYGQLRSHTCHVPDGDSQMTFDLPLLADNGHRVHQRQAFQEVAQVDKRAAQTNVAQIKHTQKTSYNRYIQSVVCLHLRGGVLTVQ